MRICLLLSLWVNVLLLGLNVGWKWSLPFNMWIAPFIIFTIFAVVFTIISVIETWGEKYDQ